MGYIIESAQHIGRSHLLDFRNRQDAIASVGGENWAAGFIADGCSEGTRSEVGANIAVQYLATETQVIMHENKLRPEQIAHDLSWMLDYYIKYTASLFKTNDERKYVNFVQNNFLFTVVGFIWTPEETAVFYAGDGTVWINDEVRYLNVGDTPLYPAYKLIPWAIPAETVIPDFTVETYNNVGRVAIASDAWKDERETADRMWEISPLQREINRMSRINHQFSDDTSIIRLIATE